jgi:hypothetical protein
MRFSTVFFWTATLLANCWAWPTDREPFCLRDSDADVIANDFAQTITNYSANFTELILAPDYTDQSDSVNTLMDGGTTSPIPVCYLLELEGDFLAMTDWNNLHSSAV